MSAQKISEHIGSIPTKMISYRKGIVKAIVRDLGDLIELDVQIGNEIRRAIAYPKLTGEITEGNAVLVNITAKELGLGSGGVDFVMANLDGSQRNYSPGGHIMKMCYTPLQGKVLSVEEEVSPYRKKLEKFQSLEGAPVVAGTLHSMVAPVCAVVKMLSGETARVVYVMTDGACLPLAYSKTVRELKEKKLIDGTITYGHAFGGDLEAVNKFTGLIAARAALEADVIVVAMGMGSIGTDTPYGYSGIEQGEILNAAKLLKGTPVACLRMSFADQRERHYGVSHHTLTALREIANPGMVIPVPQLDGKKKVLVDKQLEESGLRRRHFIEEIDSRMVFDAMKKYDLNTTTMGRGVESDPEFFLACGAAGIAAAERVISDQ